MSENILSCPMCNRSDMLVTNDQLLREEKCMCARCDYTFSYKEEVIKYTQEEIEKMIKRLNK